MRIQTQTPFPADCGIGPMTTGEAAPASVIVQAVPTRKAATLTSFTLEMNWIATTHREPLGPTFSLGLC